MKSIVRFLATSVILKGKHGTVPPTEFIPIPGAKSIPPGRFVAAYGTQGTLNMFQERRKLAFEKSVRRGDRKINVGKVYALSEWAKETKKACGSEKKR